MTQTTASPRIAETGGVWPLPRIPLLGALHPIAALAALCGLAMLPVEYRGGAEDPHPHAAYQLWYDAAHGSVAHHHAMGDAPTEAHHGEASTPAWVDEDGTDVPRLVGLSIGAVKVPLIATAVVLLTSPATTRSRAAWPAARVLVGRFPWAETPPPRSTPLLA